MFCTNQRSPLFVRFHVLRRSHCIVFLSPYIVHDIIIDTDIPVDTMNSGNVVFKDHTDYMAIDDDSGECSAAIKAGTHPAKLIALSKSLQEQGMHLQSKNCLKHAIKVSSEGGPSTLLVTIQAQYELALLSLLTNDVKAADLLFMEAVGLMSLHPEIIMALPLDTFIDMVSYAATAVLRDGTADAVYTSNMWLKIGVERAPLSFELQYSLGVGYTTANEYQNALKHLLIAESLSYNSDITPDTINRAKKAAMFTVLGEVYSKLGQGQTAADKYIKAIEQDITYTTATYRLGSLLENDGQASTAAGFYRSLIAAVGNADVKPRIKLAKALWKAGRVAEGIAEYEIAASPEYDMGEHQFHILERIVLGKRRQGNPVDALKHAKLLKAAVDADKAGAVTLLNEEETAPSCTMPGASGKSVACSELVSSAVDKLVLMLTKETAVVKEISVLLEEADQASTDADVAHACEVAEPVLKSAPSSMRSIIHEKIAGLLSRCGKFEEAAAAWKQARLFKDAPHPQQLLLNEARALRDAALIDESIKAFQEVLSQGTLQPAITPLVHETQAEALEVYNSALFNARADLARLYAAESMYPESLKLYNAWIREVPSSDVAHFEIAGVKLNIGTPKMIRGSIEALSSVINFPDSTLRVKAALGLAEIHHQQGGKLNAVKAYEQALELSEHQSIAAYMGLAVIQRKVEHFRSAAKLAGMDCTDHECVGDVPHSLLSVPLDNWMIIGSLLSGREAVDVLKAAKAQAGTTSSSDVSSETLTELYLALGTSQVAVGDYDDAMSAFSYILLELQPKHLKALNNRAISYQFMGSFHLAALDFERALTCGDDLDTRVNLAAVLIKGAKLGDAGQHLHQSSREIQKVLQRKHPVPSCVDIQSFQVSVRHFIVVQAALAFELELKGRHDAAIALYMDCITVVELAIQQSKPCVERMTPTTDGPLNSVPLSMVESDLHAYHGMALSGKGQHYEAVASIKTAIAMEPRSVSYHVDLSIALWRAGRFHESKQVLVDKRMKSLLSSTPSSRATVLHNLGVVSYSLREWKNTKSYFEQAVEISSGEFSPSVKYLKAMSRSTTERYDYSFLPESLVERDSYHFGEDMLMLIQ